MARETGEFLGDGDLISRLFDLLDQTWELLVNARSSAPLNSEARSKWNNDRESLFADVQAVASAHLEGWVPPS